MVFNTDSDAHDQTSVGIGLTNSFDGSDLCWELSYTG